MGINLLAEDEEKPINLLAEEPNAPLVDANLPENQAKALELSKQQIAAQYPNMPAWLRDAILHMTPKDESPNLGAAARGFGDVINYAPQIAAGVLQGASIPIRGAAGLIPTEFTQRLASSPDLTGLAPQPEGQNQENVQMASELLGGGGLFGKLMQGLKGGAALARVPKALQSPLALGGAGAIATPGDVSNRAMGTGGALALGAGGKVAGKVLEKSGEKIPAFMRGLTNKSTPEALIEAVQKPHDVLQNTADELYGQVRSAIKKRDVKIPINDEHLKQITEILPKTRASRKLIEKAKTGDYEAVHKLQSHLYKKGTKGLSSDDIALENQGEEILDLRDKINDDLESHLLKEGHVDIAHVLKQGKKTVAQLKKIYFDPLLTKGIGKMVHQDLRLIPKKPEELFTQNSVPMRRFLEKHPEAAKHAQGIREKEEAMKKLKNILGASAGTGGAVYLGKSIYDFLK